MNAQQREEYRQLLLEMRARLRGEVDHIIDVVHEDAAASNLSHLPTHLADGTSDAADTTVDLLHNEQGLLEAVRAALTRIEDGTYGQCLECDQEIAEPRLQAIPYTPYCIGCAAQVESDAR